jgi:hypothetical protein
MENLKPAKAYSVRFTGEWARSYNLSDFLFDSEKQAREFIGIQKADIIEVEITPIKKL